jgi:hypothetical protein
MSKPDRTPFLFLVAYLAFFGALVLGADAAWHAYRRHVESTWPSVAADVSDCAIHTWHDTLHRRRQSHYEVTCVFRYRVADVPHVVTSKIGDTLSIADGQINLTRPAVTPLALRSWVKQHPNGTTERVHYDPADPDRISLAGADDNLRWQTTAAYRRGALVAALGGAVLLGLGIRARRAGRAPAVPGG